MSKAEKLFAKLFDGRHDANFSFDDLCSLLTKLGYTMRKPEEATSSFNADQAF